ncbi:hypothetical protein [Steroidobacter sp.]|uniref:hypothetical protein n=1 Tax=Steroidobacter sp. TaxID=1978227 RepID=UPI001A55C827|nr:hypothetical protein [Steroidobacter sp.]MBL8266124.1 hypothetical protein [Steroidobacter sp.]
MRVEAFSIRLRRRGKIEATDLGIRLCQQAARSVFACYLRIYVPVLLLAIASFELAYWAPTLVIWWAKPWLDRSVLFVLSRAAFGQTTTFRDLWQAQRDVWWRQLLVTLTWRRLSPWRSLTQPVYQLEGLSGWKLRKRVVQIRGDHRNTGLLITTAFSLAELALWSALLSLALWFVPGEQQFNWTAMFLENEHPGQLASYVTFGAYAVIVAFLEPFYVAAGFALYLNRRVELEAWDVEQELRRAFTR